MGKLQPTKMNQRKTIRLPKPMTMADSCPPGERPAIAEIKKTAAEGSMEGKEKKKWYQRIEIIAALIGAVGGVVAAIIGGIFALIAAFSNSNDQAPPATPRVEVHSPVEARALGNDLLLTIRFNSHNLNDHKVRAEVATVDTFTESVILKTLQLSKEHRCGPRTTTTIPGAADVQTGYVRIVVVDNSGNEYPSNVVQFNQ